MKQYCWLCSVIFGGNSLHPFFEVPQGPFNFLKVPGQDRRGFEFNFYQDEVSLQVEGSNSTFQKFPAKTRVRIQLFKSFPPRRGFEFNFSKVSRQSRRGFEFNFSKVSRQNEGSNSTFQKKVFPLNAHAHTPHSLPFSAASRRRRRYLRYLSLPLSFCRIQSLHR